MNRIDEELAVEVVALVRTTKKMQQQRLPQVLILRPERWLTPQL
jgi:hypothetical protein